MATTCGELLNCCYCPNSYVGTLLTLGLVATSEPSILKSVLGGVNGWRLVGITAREIGIIRPRSFVQSLCYSLLLSTYSGRHYLCEAACAMICIAIEPFWAVTHRTRSALHYWWRSAKSSSVPYKGSEVEIALEDPKCHCAINTANLAIGT